MALDALPRQIRASSTVRSRDDHLQDARRHIDELFPDIDELLSQVTRSDDTSGSSKGADVGAVSTDNQLSRTSSRTGHAYQAGRRGKRRRTFNEEVAHWEREEAAASADVRICTNGSGSLKADELMVQVEKTAKSLPILLDETQAKLQNLLSSAQKLSLERYTLTDQLSGLLDDLAPPVDATGVRTGITEGYDGAQGQTLLQQMSDLQDELARLEAGLTWATVLEKVLSLRYVSLFREDVL
jgi:hypothetical protein